MESRPGPVRGRVVSWMHFHGRSAALARALGFAPIWAPAWTRSRHPLLRYVAATTTTVRAVLFSRGPVVVQLPPFPALLVVVLSRLGRRTRVMGDLHSGVFLYSRWRWARAPTLWLLRRHAAIVTNEANADVCRQAGVAVFLLDDPLEPPPTPAVEAAGHPSVLVVLSYEYDEPVHEILRAAATLPATPFVLSGAPPEPVRRAAPANVVFTGFLPRTEFLARLRASSLVVALTTEPDTMQRGAYEALENGVPVVTSDSRVLRDYFRDAAVYARPTPEGIAAAVAEALPRRDELRRRVLALRDEKLVEQQKALEQIRTYLTGG
jgi:glycosyltransferase involved in cell wall biosynthesis